MQEYLLRAELMLASEDDRAFGYLFNKLERYPNIVYGVREDKIIVFGESAHLSYIIEILVRQLAGRFDDTTLRYSYQFALEGIPSNVH